MMEGKTMSSAISAEKIEQYRRDGCVVFPQVLDADLIQEVSDHVTWLQRQHPDLRPEHLHHRLMWDDPFWLRLISDDRLLNIAEAAIGPDIALFASHYICKPPGDGMPVLWHQDGSYWPLEPMEVTTVWLAIDDSDAENGCMRILPGSHQSRGVRQHHPSEEKPNVLSSEIRLSEEDEARAVDVVVPSGGVSLHDPFVVHGSNPNTSPRRRCGLTIRYMPTSTKITREWTTFLLRGEDRRHVNEYSPLPAYREGEHFPFRDVGSYPGGRD